jgi:DNA-binding transcriptional ArsR family regulator
MPRPDKRETAVLRALGSPVRQDILEQLVRGPATSAMLARALSSNTGVMSYHLRALGAAGLVEPQERRGRALYWRLSHADVRFQDPSRSTDPGQAEAAIDLIMARLGLAVRGYLDRDDLSEAWRDAALFSNASTALNAAEMAEFAAEYLALLQRWTHRPAARRRRGGPTRPVRIAFFAFPDDVPPAEDPS